MSGIEAITSEQLDELLQSSFGVFGRTDPATVRRMDAAGRCRGESVCCVAGGRVSIAGHHEDRFTLMSAVKPFLLLRAFECHGQEKVASWVDDEPSELPYYSLEQLRQDGGKPRNAMINSGAMLLASKLPGDSPVEQQRLFVEWLSDLAPDASVSLDQECFAEVMQREYDPYNRALAEELEQVGGVECADAAFDVYFRLCCLAGSIRDVALLGDALACGGSPFRRTVLATMNRCGLYEASAAWWQATGLPSKSGVSGVMFGVWPGEGCVAAASSWLDSGGNPILPQVVLASLAAEYPPKTC